MALGGEAVSLLLALRIKALRVPGLGDRLVGNRKPSSLLLLEGCCRQMPGGSILLSPAQGYWYGSHGPAPPLTPAPGPHPSPGRKGDSGREAGLPSGSSTLLAAVVGGATGISL